MGRGRRFTRGHRQRIAAIAGALWVMLLLPAQAQEDVRSFALPNTRAAQALVTAVEDHLAAERMQEAAAQLQELLEEHADALLPGRRDEIGGRRSEQPVHEGVGPWATARLFSLPPGPQSSYRDRYEEKAAAQLERALRATDREALAAVGTRWPLTRAAERAWWALGDLSLERGHLAESRDAWRRGAAWALGEPDLSLASSDDWRGISERFSDRSDAEEIMARLSFAASSLETRPSFDAESRRPPHGELRLPGEGELSTGPSAGDNSAWSEPYPLAQHPYSASTNNFFAARSDERLVVTNSMRAVCIHAFSGELLWDSGEAPGWEKLRPSKRNEFHKALDHYGAMYAPALTDKVAICALEVPFSVIENQDFNHIPILRIIPDRRLVAFDLSTGAELWSHRPEKGWDGESGSFSETSRVAGPAVIAGGRVLVPTYRLEGRISFHVACYELATGALIWNTQLISGQRELNMFNRHQREFSAPPLRVEGDRVLALTQLGVVACLDLFNGQLVWETLYDQVAIPQRSHFRARTRESTWSNSPPVVGDDVVVCTPMDSRDMIGLDLASGAMLWSIGLRDLERLAGGFKSRLEHLIGCDETTVFLSGERVLAVEAPLGLSNAAPTRRRWVAEDDSTASSSRPPRAVLLEDRVVVPTHSHRLDIDRHQGFLLANPARWSSGRPGNLLICEDAVFTLDNDALNGYFEWDSLLGRARAALVAEPVRAENAFILADLLRERARTELGANRPEAARAILDEAEAILRGRLDPAVSSGGAKLRLHEVLVTRALALERLSDKVGALKDWAESSDLAPNKSVRLKVLLEEQRLLRSQDPTAWLALLAEIESECGRLQVACAVSDEKISGLHPLRLLHDAENPALWEIEARLWAICERIEHYGAQNEDALELKELYQLIDLGSSAIFPTGPAREVALRRLDQLLSKPGARALLEPYEERARELLTELGELEPAAIAAVLRRYPRTAAASRASGQLLRSAAEIGDVPTAAKIVFDLLPEIFSVGSGDPSHSSRVVALGLALRETGNEAYLRACLRRLATTGSLDSPELKRVHSENILELATELLSDIRPAPTRAPTFSSRARPVWNTPSGLDVKILGELPPGPSSPERPERVLLVGTREVENPSRDGELLAFGSSDPSQPLWRRPLGGEAVSVGWREDLHLFGAGYAVLASERALEVVNRSEGSTRWRWRPANGEIYALDSDEGLILVTVRVATRTFRIQALDEVHGEPLWSFEYDSRSYHRTAVCGESWLVLLPTGRLRSAVVLDGFTGRVALTVELEAPLPSRLAQGAWIKDQKLFIPHLTARQLSVSAEVDLIDLTGQADPWTLSIALPDGGEAYLDNVLRHGDRTWLVVRPRGGEESRRAAVYELHSGVGAAARIHGLSLGRNELILGTESGRNQALDTAQVFVRTEEQGGAIHRLRSHDLITGAHLWTWELGSNRDLYNRRWPTPAVSANSVALVFTEKTANLKMRTNLLFLDPLSGVQTGSMILSEPLGWSDQVDLEVLGDGLLLSGVQMMEVLR